MYTDNDLFYTMRKTPLKGHSSLIEEKSVLNIRNRDRTDNIETTAHI